MENGLERAQFWRDFILERAQYPSPSRLRSQFEGARFFDFCNCGCNSFRIEPTNSSRQPLFGPPYDPGKRAFGIFEAIFSLEDDKFLSIVIFADGDGSLSGVDVEYCANNYPVPETIEIKQPPFHTRASDGVFADKDSDRDR